MSVKANVQEVYNLLFAGKGLEAFDKFYGENVVMIEGDGAVHEGKETNRKREEEFFASVKEFHDAGIIALAIDEENGMAFVENFMDVTFQNDFRTKLEQVAVQQWKDGKIVKERFYYNKG